LKASDFATGIKMKIYSSNGANVPITFSVPKV